MKFSIFVVFAAILVSTNALCDPWGARQCGINFYHCTGMANATGTSSDSEIVPPPITPATRCHCFGEQGKCLQKYDCYNSAPYYVFHFTCLGEGCGEAQCGSASHIFASVAFLVPLLMVSFI